MLGSKQEGRVKLAFSKQDGHVKFAFSKQEGCVKLAFSKQEGRVKLAFSKQEGLSRRSQCVEKNSRYGRKVEKEIVTISDGLVMNLAIR